MQLGRQNRKTEKFQNYKDHETRNLAGFQKPDEDYRTSPLGKTEILLSTALSGFNQQAEEKHQK